MKQFVKLDNLMHFTFVFLAMRERLQDAEMTSRYQDRERQSLVTQLSEQNGRLTTELQAASRREEELQTRLSELRSQVNDKRLSMQDHILYLENLKDEVRQHFHCNVASNISISYIFKYYDRMIIHFCF